MSDTAQIAYLLLAGLFMAFVTAGAVRGRGRGWQISAVLVWIALFVILGFLADRLGLRLR